MICSDAFRATGDAMADVQGAPGYRYLTTPHPVAGLTPEQHEETVMATHEHHHGHDHDPAHSNDHGHDHVHPTLPDEAERRSYYQRMEIADNVFLKHAITEQAQQKNRKAWDHRDRSYAGQLTYTVYRPHQNVGRARVENRFDGIEHQSADADLRVGGS